MVSTEDQDELVEERITDPITGGQKGRKLARFDLIWWPALWALANVYGQGAKKYADDNWKKGYSWKLSLGAMLRHLMLWVIGEKYDKETGCHHLAQVMWHCCALMYFEVEHPTLDDIHTGKERFDQLFNEVMGVQDGTSNN
jgi:hypothetical protein